MYTDWKERSGDTAFRMSASLPKSGVALRFPPQSKNWLPRNSHFALIRVNPHYYP
jgi:hypothetical protein